MQTSLLLDRGERKIVIVSTQDVEPILERNKALRGEPQRGHDCARLVADIPAVSWSGGSTRNTRAATRTCGCSRANSTTPWCGASCRTRSGVICGPTDSSRSGGRSIQRERRSLLPSVTTGSRLAASGGRAAWQGANSVSTDCGDGGGQSWAGTKYQKAQIVRAEASPKAAVPRTEPREGMATIS